MFKMALTLTALGMVGLASGPAMAEDALEVVTTLPYLTTLAETIGGDSVRVVCLTRPGENPGAGKVSQASAAALVRAQIFIENGLGLEGWAAELVTASRNPRIQIKAIGRVVAASGMKTSETQRSGSKPYVWLNPVHLKQMVMTIEKGLAAGMPEKAAVFRARRAAFAQRLNKALYGRALVRIIGSARLDKLLETGRLIAFLNARSYRKKALADYAGGWLGRAMALKTKTYHAADDAWRFWAQAFGLAIIASKRERVPKAGLFLQARFQKRESSPGVLTLPIQPDSAEPDAIFALYSTMLSRLESASKR